MAKNGFKFMDSDMHIAEPWDLWEKWIEPNFRDRAPKCRHEHPTDLVGVVVEGRPIPSWRTDTDEKAREAMAFEAGFEAERTGFLREAIERNFDPVSQLNAMDVEGIDTAILFPSRGLSVMATDYQDTKLAAAVARAYNNWLADFCQADLSRLYGAAMVAVHDVQEAVAEVRRTKEEFGFRAIFVRPNPVRGRNWHNPYYDPLWAECERRGMAVIFHESSSTTLPQAMGERFSMEIENIAFLQHIASHPIEQMYACLCMVCGGVLERFPGLQVGFLEGNCSWAPFWLWRMDEHTELPAYQHRRDKVLKMLPSEYFKRQCFVAIEADEAPAKLAIDWMGNDNIVFSTDYPHPDSKYPNASAAFLELPLSDESKRKILWDNCARLYGF